MEECNIAKSLGLEIILLVFILAMPLSHWENYLLTGCGVLICKMQVIYGGIMSNEILSFFFVVLGF
jgi:hypothetical protein